MRKLIIQTERGRFAEINIETRTVQIHAFTVDFEMLTAMQLLVIAITEAIVNKCPTQSN